MDKVSRINVEGRDYEVLSGGAVRGASASLANDWTKTVVLPQGAEPLDGIFLVVTFVYGNSVGTTKPQTVYSSDGQTFYADEALTVPVTLPDPQNYSVTLVSGEEYSLQTYPVLNVNGAIFPVCNAKGYLCGGDKLWSPGDKVVILISDGYAQIMSAGISGSGITVYESLDDILEDLPNLSVGDVLATYDKKDIKTGVPLGTWASFANDSAPNGEWLQAGTAFNENTYPALAMMLGNNVVPEMFDHNRPSAWEDVASTNTFTPAYDGFMAVSYYNSGVIIKVNGVQIDIDNSPSNANGNMTLPFKKGDVITFFNVYDGSARTIAFKVYYYKHPLFIKATPTSSDTDYEGTLNAIRNFTANAESYSTEEKWTGGYWIDGKKIYRKVFNINNPVINWSRTALNFSDIDWIVKREYTGKRTSGGVVITEYYNHDSDNFEIHLLVENGVLYYYCQCTTALSVMSVTIEYTKLSED